jgi:hypothetical protein
MPGVRRVGAQFPQSRGVGCPFDPGETAAICIDTQGPTQAVAGRRMRRERLERRAGHVEAQNGKKAPKAVEHEPADGARSDVTAFLASKAHPLEAEINALRTLTLGMSPSIREEIKWNSVSFRNENDFFCTVHLHARSSVQLILFTGVKKKATAETGVAVEDPAGIIAKWLAKDRCLVSLGAGSEFEANRAAFLTLVAAWIEFV